MRAPIRLVSSASVTLPALGAVLLAPALVLSTACRPMIEPPDDEDPGDTFVITAGLTSNGCAPGLDPIDPLVFAASLRREGSLAYWRIGEQPWIPGTMGRDGRFHFTLRTDVEIYPPTRGTDPDLDPGRAGCVVTMVESIDGELIEAARPDAGTSDASQADDAGDAGTTDAGGTATMWLEGTNRIELVPVSGSDCSLALLSSGGAFPTLPCAAEYDLEGER